MSIANINLSRALAGISAHLPHANNRTKIPIEIAFSDGGSVELLIEPEQAETLVSQLNEALQNTPRSVR